jgi:hypothetical protein
VKVVAPSRLLAEAADVLAAVRDDVLVIGAAALEVALPSASSVVITPTRDVDVVVPVERAAEIVSHLEAADTHRSEVEHERAFTWVEISRCNSCEASIRSRSRRRKRCPRIRCSA